MRFDLCIWAIKGGFLTAVDLELMASRVMAPFLAVLM